MTCFCPLASGSNGNSVFVGCESTRVLFDAGSSGKRIQSSLRLIDIEPESISAIIITHEHCDHIIGAGVLSRRFDVPLYATEKTWIAMEREPLLGPVSSKNKKIVCYDEIFTIGEMRIKPFKLSHDAAEPAGYSVFAEKYKISIATDLGLATDGVKDNLYDSDILLLESNHDVEMLKNGSYPWPLKKRIMSDFGHLSNLNCGTLITEIFSDRIKHVYLGHLSEENNRPYLAMETVCSILEANGIRPGSDFDITLADRGQVSEYIELKE